MAQFAEATAGAVATPGLVFFYSKSSGRCRKVDAYIAQVLQRRRNHETFRLYRVASEERPDLVRRFRVDTIPTLLVVDGGRVRARLRSPRNCREIETLLAPWLR